MSNHTTITPEFYEKLKISLSEYVVKSGRKNAPYYLSALNSFIDYLHGEKIHFSSLKYNIVQEYSNKSKYGFTIVRDFLIKSGHCEKDINASINSQTSVLFSEHIENYLLHISMEGKRDNSITIYRKHLHAFVEYFGEMSLSEINKDVIEKYIYYMLNSKSNRTKKRIDVSTMQSRIMTLNQYMRYLIKKNIILYNPVEYTKLPRKEMKISQNFLSKDEMKYFLQNIPSATVTDCRNKVLFLLAYNAALRINEAIHIKVRDINLDIGVLYIEAAKGGNKVHVPITIYMQNILKGYMKKTNPKDYLFATLNNTPLKYQNVNKYLSKYLRALGMKKRITFHAFRKSVAMHMLENGLDVRYIQRYLRHCSIKTTAAYTKLDIGDLKEAIKKHHPREQHKSDYIMRFQERK